MLYAMLSMLRSSLSYVFYVRSTYFHVSYHVFVPRSIFPMCCLARSTCFYGCLHVYLSFLHALCFMPCLDPSFLCVDVWIYMLTCLISCLWLCYAQIYMFLCMFNAPMPMSMPSHVCMLGFAFFHAFMLTSTCLDVHLHAYMHISILICVDWCVYMLRSMFSTCFMPSSMCLHASCHVYVLRPRPCLSCHVLLQPFCSFYSIFLCFGLLVRTQSRPYGFCHHPYTKAHIKGFGSSYLHIYACLLLCFMLVLTSLVLSFAMFGALRGLHLVWLHPSPMRPCSDVTIWEASPDAGFGDGWNQ